MGSVTSATADQQATTISGNTRMSVFTRVVLWFIAINALAGASSLILLPTHTDTLFFWEIKPPINAALFGALYLGGAIVVSLVSYRGQWESARFLVPVLVSAGLFISLTTLIHLDRFAHDFKLVYWLIIYIGAPVLALVLYIYYERRGTNWAVTEPIRPITRSIAIVTGAIVVALGMVILAWPELAIPNWPWPISPLMVRVFASWFSAFGVGLLWFYFEKDWSRVYHIASMMIVAAVFDLGLVIVHRNDLTSVGPNFWIFCFHLAAFGVIGLLLHGLQRRQLVRKSLPS